MAHEEDLKIYAFEKSGDIGYEYNPYKISNFKVVKTQNDPSGGEGGNTSGSQGGSDEPDTKPDGGTTSTRTDSTNNLLKNTTFDNF